MTMASTILVGLLLFVLSEAASLPRHTQRPAITFGWNHLNPQEGRIVVGNDTSDLVPFLVSLQRKWGAHFCGGTIVDESTILTARHCVDGTNFKLNDTRIMAGTNDVKNVKGNEFVQIRTVVDMRKNKPEMSFSSLSLDADFALLKLDKPLVWSDRVGPAKLARRGQASVGAPVIQYGWGLYKPGGPTSDVLRRANSTIIKCPPKETCICVAARACSGDSGGPLVSHQNSVRNTYVVGVARSVTTNGPCMQEKPSDAAYDQYSSLFGSEFNEFFDKWGPGGESWQ